jgi:hypothetical protein
VKTLEQLRDELADNGFRGEYLGGRGYDEIQAFKDGWDARNELAKDQLKKITKALDMMKKGLQETGVCGYCGEYTSEVLDNVDKILEGK